MKKTAITLLLFIVINVFAPSQVVFATIQNATGTLLNPITYKVVDKNNKPVINATLTIFTTDGKAVYGGETQLTNANGEVTLQNYPKVDKYPCKVGKYSMSISMYTDAENPVVEKVAFELTKNSTNKPVVLKMKGTSTHNKLLASTKRVEFIVVDSEGAPVSNVKCNFADNQPQTNASDSYRSYSGYTDANGKVAFVRSKTDKSNGVFSLNFESKNKGITKLTCVLPTGETKIIDNNKLNLVGYSGSISVAPTGKALTWLNTTGVSTFKVSLDIQDGSSPEPIPFKGGTIIEAHSFDYANRSYHKIANPALVTDIALRLNEYTPNVADDENQVGFLIVTEKGKYEYYLPSDEKTASAQDKPLITMAKNCNEKYFGAAQWLAFMSTSNITSVSFGQDDLIVNTTDPLEIEVISDFLKGIAVERNPQAADALANPTTGAGFNMTIKFKSGEIYSLISAEYNKFSVSAHKLEKLIYYKVKGNQLNDMYTMFSNLGSAVYKANAEA